MAKAACRTGGLPRRMLAHRLKIRFSFQKSEKV
jgi:hypothetical protein